MRWNGRREWVELGGSLFLFVACFIRFIDVLQCFTEGNYIEHALSREVLWYFHGFAVDHKEAGVWVMT